MAFVILHFPVPMTPRRRENIAVTTADFFRDKAARCRRFADGINQNDSVVASLREMALEFDRKAAFRRPQKRERSRCALIRSDGKRRERKNWKSVNRPTDTGRGLGSCGKKRCCLMKKVASSCCARQTNTKHWRTRHARTRKILASVSVFKPSQRCPMGLPCVCNYTPCRHVMRKSAAPQNLRDYELGTSRAPPGALTNPNS